MDDLVALIFLAGLALSAWPWCGVALVGCVLDCMVVIGAVIAYVIYIVESTRVINNADENPFRVKDEVKEQVKTSVSQLPRAPAPEGPSSP